MTQPSEKSPPSIRLGVIVARVTIDHPWQDHAWRADAVTLDALDLPIWTELRRDAKSTTYFAGAHVLDLHIKETPAYCVNLEGGKPAVYVVLRPDERVHAPAPVFVHLVTASPYEAQAYLESGSELVQQVAMPAALVERLAQFIDAHHIEVPFKKRRRDERGMASDEPVVFSKEPVADREQRMAGGQWAGILKRTAN